MLQIQEFEDEKEQVSKEHRPTLTKWKGEPMVRIHSIRATVKEILQVSKVLDVVKIGIVGEPATGKTTLAKTIAHIIHKTSDVPFAVRVFGKDEFLEMEKTLAKLEPANYVLIFDDLSFLTNKKQIDEVKRVITIIRHLREDVRIILIYDYHYTLGLDKYLRQANFRYFTSVGSSEDENMLKIVGPKYASRIKQFQDMFVQMVTKYKAVFKIGPKTFFSYNYKNPFVVCLFFNNSRLRFVVFPQRQWIDKICSTCTDAGYGGKMTSEIPVDQFLEESYQKFDKYVFQAAIKLKLLVNGMNVYSPSIVAASRYLDRALEKKLISLEEIAVRCNFTITNAKLRKKLDGVLE